MKNYQSLTRLISSLKNSSQVQGIFLTSSTVTGIRKTSDIDLVIIIKNNAQRIRSIYTMLEGHFADIFFFDLQFLKSLQTKSVFSANAMDGIFITWLLQGKIVFDPMLLLNSMQTKLRKRQQTFAVSEQEKREWWVKN